MDFGPACKKFSAMLQTSIVNPKKLLAEPARYVG